MQKFEDTPDDLLKNLDNLDRSNENVERTRISELALEHAARRVGLIKLHGVSEWARNKRQNGIKVSDYSSAQLFTFLQDGKNYKITAERNKEIQEQLATYPTPEVEADVALGKASAQI